jgi:cytochrome c biogenesis protein CcmG/thiol:disulfide interchange protein DsbE
MPRRPILLGLLVASLATLGVLLIARPAGDGGGGEPHAAVGGVAPSIVGTTLDGSSFSLAELRGRPVVVNFWGPSCVPCRDEFPLLAAKLAEHAPDGLAIVGVLTDDPPEPARDFVAEYGASWPTVIDPDKALKIAYRVAARPQTYFVGGDGIIRKIQIGELTDADFERQYALIAP